MKTPAFFILPIEKRWGGGPPKVVEGPRESAENPSASLAEFRRFGITALLPDLISVCCVIAVNEAI
jgi:hypothetical protein